MYETNWTVREEKKNFPCTKPLRQSLQPNFTFFPASMESWTKAVDLHSPAGGLRSWFEQEAERPRAWSILCRVLGPYPYYTTWPLPY